MTSLDVFISGDFAPIGKEKKILSNKPVDIFGKLKKTIHDSDLSITNLEAPLTSNTSPITKLGPNLSLSPKIAKFLKDSGFGLMTLANNHIYDQGEKGLKSTFNSLKKENLNYVGAGENLKLANKPFYCKLKNYNLAILNFAEVEFSCANENHGGANPLDLISNIRKIKEAAKQTDYVIVIVHGGHENFQYPSPEMLKRYRFLAENGADVVIGHHTHCVGGYEVYQDVPIFYSLGNFLFPDYKQNKNYPSSWFEGYSVKLNITDSGLDFEIIPYVQCKKNSLEVNLKGKDSYLYKKIEKISNDLQNLELIQEKWENYVKEKKSYLGYMNGLGVYTTHLLNRMGLLEYLINKKKLSWIKQFITCEAHKETAVKLLKEYLKY